MLAVSNASAEVAVSEGFFLLHTFASCMDFVIAQIFSLVCFCCLLLALLKEEPKHILLVLKRTVTDHCFFWYAERDDGR